MMTIESMRRLAVVLTIGLATSACLDDSEDGKASAWMWVALDSGVRDAGTSDGSVAEGALLDMVCPTAVVSDHTLAGFSVRMLRAGLPVAGAYVALSPSTGVVVSAEPGGGITDANGSIAFSFAAPHFDLVTPISLEASTRGADGKVAASARCNFQIVTAGLAFQATQATQVANGTPSALTVRVLARDVAPRCTDAGGVLVGFLDANRGGVSAAYSDAPAATTCVDIDPGGSATFFVHAGVRGGPARLEAGARDYTAALDVTVIGAPAVVTLASDVDDIGVNSAANLTAKVLDDAAQPVRGVTLQFAFERCAALPCGGTEKLLPTSAITLADGTARFAYFAPATPGAAQVTATVAGTTSAQPATIVLRVN